MQPPAGAPPSWPSWSYARQHFLLHGAKLGVGSVWEYDSSARDTIAVGKWFVYRDPVSSDLRIGYFDPASKRFTVLNEDETLIVTHFRADEQYIRALPDSDYR